MIIMFHNFFFFFVECRFCFSFTPRHLVPRAHTASCYPFLFGWLLRAINLTLCTRMRTMVVCVAGKAGVSQTNTNTRCPTSRRQSHRRPSCCCCWPIIVAMVKSPIVCIINTTGPSLDSTKRNSHMLFFCLVY